MLARPLGKRAQYGVGRSGCHLRVPRSGSFPEGQGHGAEAAHWPLSAGLEAAGSGCEFFNLNTEI